MSRKAWMRHPARTLGKKPVCPTGWEYFATWDRARHALVPFIAASDTETVTCPHCHGWHNTHPTRTKTP